ncbi:pyrophosphate--fructose 6-phosphate 1-phosphotransferase subunit alpha [Tanacetum coccineum]
MIRQTKIGVQGVALLVGQVAEPLAGSWLPVLIMGDTIKDIRAKFRKLDMFEGNDFRRWQKKMHFLLTMMKVVYVLSTPMSEFVEDETLEHRRKGCKRDKDDYICHGHILNEYASSKNFLVSNFNNYKMVDSRAICGGFLSFLQNMVFPRTHLPGTRAKNKGRPLHDETERGDIPSLLVYNICFTGDSYDDVLPLLCELIVYQLQLLLEVYIGAFASRWPSSCYIRAFASRWPSPWYIRTFASHWPSPWYIGALLSGQLYTLCKARGSLPSKFDCDYVYVLGHCYYHILAAGLNGYMVTVTNLKSPSDKWRCGAAPITVGFHLFICISLTIMVVDLGPGTTTVGKSVVHPVTIDLRGKVCELLRQNATRFLMDDVYRNLDPLQFEGPGVDSKAVSLCVEDLDYMGHIKELNNYLDKVRTIVKPGCSQDVLKAALSAMASVTDIQSVMTSQHIE